jgi:hypothetical protein
MRVVKSRRMAWGELYDEHNWGGKYTESFGQIPERNGERTRPMRRWKDNIQMYFK